VDLLFLDVQMPELTGISLLKVLQKKPFVVLTTAYSEYALEGYELDVTDYLLKPIGYNEFLKAANKARMYFESMLPTTSTEEKRKEFLFIKADYKVNKISLDDIVYIEGMREYIRIHLVNGKSLMPHYSLKALEEQLPSGLFMRVHRSYIVNLDKVVTVQNSRIVFSDKVFIPVSEQYSEIFYNWLGSHSLG